MGENSTCQVLARVKTLLDGFSKFSRCKRLGVGVKVCNWGSKNRFLK
jgi:hypothetical protein